MSRGHRTSDETADRAVDGSTGDSAAKSDYHIRLQDVTKRYNGGEIVAVEDFNLDIGEEEFVVFLGPSGCGKTTTLRCISGLETPDEGTISIADEDVTNEKPKDRNLAFVFQDVALYPHMSIRENLRFGLDMNTDLGSDDKEQRVNEAAEVLGIDELLDRKPDQLSGGQQQRVELGRAMVMDPEAFLLDEPFSALDANLRDRMQTEIQKLQNRIEKSMVFVTHDQEEAMTLGDRIVVMDDGTVQQVGSPYEIYNQPENRFVAEFIGSPSTNTVEGRLERAGDGWSVTTDLFTIELTGDQTEQLADLDPRDVTLAVRPAYVDVVGDDDGLFTAPIDVIEPKSDKDVVHLLTEDVSVRALADQGEFTEIGREVAVSIDPENVWLFGEDGERLL